MGFLNIAWTFLKGNNLAAIALAASLLWGYHIVVVKIQESKIEALETDNKTLKTNQIAIETANKTLASSIGLIQRQQDEISKNVKEFQDKNADLKEWFELQRIKLSNDEDSIRSFVKDDPKGFISKMNQEINCMIEQFGRNNCFFVIGDQIKGRVK